MIHVAARPVSGMPLGAAVDTSTWPKSATIAALRVGTLALRDDAAVYRPLPRAAWCSECCLPYNGRQGLAEHVRARHGTTPAADAPLAVAAVRHVVTARQIVTLAAGTCPICGEAADRAHMADRHPEYAMPAETAKAAA